MIMECQTSIEAPCLFAKATRIKQTYWRQRQLRVRVRGHRVSSFPLFTGNSKQLRFVCDSEDGSPYSLKLGKPRLRKKSFTMLHGFLGPVSVAAPLDPDEGLINEDLRPTSVEERSFSGWEMASLWIGMVVGVPSYYMAGSLVEMGMAWWQGIATVMAGNLLLLFPLVLTGHPGTKYGIPFPVLCRASFGIRGAHVPTILRGLVGCGWYGIETWIGGQAIFMLLNSLRKGTLTGQLIPWLGTSAPEFGCFLIFWVLQMLFIWNGMESIRKLEKYSAPILMTLSAALLLWAYVNAGGFGSMLSIGSQFGKGGAQEGKFWSVFFPSLTANISFWFTVAINITDFTRYVKSQADQIVGQVGLPIFMGAFTFLGLAVTSSTEIIFGQVISNPIDVLGRIGGIVPISLSIFGIALATLTTNIAANVVAPANALVNFSPSWFTFRRGALLTALIGILFQPWRLLQSSESFIYTWLIGYSALLGPIGAIVLVDYYILRNCDLDINDLYSGSPLAQYWHYKGYNITALVSLLIGILPVIPGFLQTIGVLKLNSPIYGILYNNAWFVSLFAAGFAYWILSLSQGALHTKASPKTSTS
ncbi:hypothetical protein SUGI_0052040 [Cryptomeria japonica]|uniref:purine-uracil permease NCS1 n=1 Tax=Cryptomeria japonica TaxID=3369 RepID=UPI002408DBEC|nr:purine-uracil permease NCS1 [Cryptomeria japonica]GLJ06905.1 hypothetical protein SUGI_0052040 [Cryptomeria japonica]